MSPDNFQTAKPPLPGTAKPPLDHRLAELPLFNGLSPEEITRITQGMKEAWFEKGEILFNKGDECKGMHLLLAGQIKLSFISHRGDEKVVEIITPNQTFGEAVMFMDSPYVVSAQATADSWLLFFKKTIIFDELERDPMLARKMLAGLSMRLHRLIGDIEDYSLNSSKKRFINYLLREIPDGTPQRLGSNAFTIKLIVNKNTLASRLNMTQEHFSRILHELTALGLIAVHSREVHIPDIRKLQQYED